LWTQSHAQQYAPSLDQAYEDQNPGELRQVLDHVGLDRQRLQIEKAQQKLLIENTKIERKPLDPAAKEPPRRCAQLPESPIHPTRNPIYNPLIHRSTPPSDVLRSASPARQRVLRKSPRA